jgi:hypothetical protein
MAISRRDHESEPVPPASQLAGLLFLAAVEGYLRGASPSAGLRVTMHRAMNREGAIYLQQVCPYLGSVPFVGTGGTGRMFPVTEGIIGAAFAKGRVLRTRQYAQLQELEADILTDMKTTNREGDLSKEARSWLAVPFLGPSREPVLVLFADTREFNFFADDERTNALVRMCWGFCRLVDNLESRPFPNLRNFPFMPGQNVEGMNTFYPTVQEELADLPVPQFERVRSFNFEASIA